MRRGPAKRLGKFRSRVRVLVCAQVLVRLEDDAALAWDVQLEVDRLKARYPR